MTFGQSFAKGNEITASGYGEQLQLVTRLTTYNIRPSQKLQVPWFGKRNFFSNIFLDNFRSEQNSCNTNNAIFSKVEFEGKPHRTLAPWPNAKIEKKTKHIIFARHRHQLYHMLKKESTSYHNCTPACQSKDLPKLTIQLCTVKPRK